MTSAPGQKPSPPATARRVSPLEKLRAQEEEDMRDEKKATVSFRRLKLRVIIQTWVMAVLAFALMAILPFAQPVYIYYAMAPDKSLVKMTGLAMSNMTNKAILSWATTNITEVMTMGFGDMDVKLPKQRRRFTKSGWEAYVKAFIREGIGETFKQSQLVLTTVPSNTPVIVYQGLNANDVYEWVVQMPVVMTYATNNEVTSERRSLIFLTIVRVPVEENPFGIAIDNWSVH